MSTEVTLYCCTCGSPLTATDNRFYVGRVGPHCLGCFRAIQKSEFARRAPEREANRLHREANERVLDADDASAEGGEAT